MMRYFPLSGRLIMTDDRQEPPHVIFDTSEPFLCVKPSDVIVGSQVVPARTASSQGVDGDQNVVDIERNYFLAQIDIPGAKVVRGMMRSTWSSNPEPADNLWRQASGTHLDILDGVNQTQVPQSDTGGYARVATMGGYTLYVDGLGNLMLRERIVMRARDPGSPGTTFNRARRQATISFRLLVGFFLDQDFSPKPIADFVDYVQRNTSFPSNNQNMGCSFGFPFAGRRLVAFSHMFDSGFGINGPTSVSIAGVPATFHGNVARSNSYRTRVWSAVVPDGTSGTVRLSSSNWGNVLNLGLELYAVGGVSGSPVITSDTSGGATANCAVNVGPNSIAVVASAHEGGGGGVEWTNVSARNAYTSGGSGGRYGSGIIEPGAGGVVAQARWGGSNPTGIIAATFSAA